MILYYAPTACSIAAHIALEETGLPYTAQGIDLGKGEQTSPEFLKVNPQGRVPALVVDGRTITELPALLTYIASLKPDARLVPDPGTIAFARCFEWLGYLSSTLHVMYAQFRRPTRFVPEEFSCLHQLSEHGHANTIAAFREVERRLVDPWAAGHEYSIADMYLYPFFTWAWRLDFDIASECPRWAAQVDRLTQRPAVQSAIEQEAPRN